MKCNPKCIYYPSDSKEKIKEYTDEYGVKHQENIYICRYSGDRITKYNKCQFYKSLDK